MRAYDAAIMVFGLSLLTAPLFAVALFRRSRRRFAWTGLKVTLAVLVLSLGIAMAISPPKEVLEAEAAARTARIEQAERERAEKAAVEAEAKRVAAVAAEKQRKQEEAERAAQSERDKAERAKKDAEAAEEQKRQMAELLAPKPLLRGVVGCLQREAHDRLSTIAGSDDREAFTKLATLLVASGRCRILKKDTRVHLEDTAIFSGAVCVRPAGEIACYWLPIDAYK